MNKDTNKEMNNEKTTLEKYKESFLNALMSAGIVLVVLFIIWIPFKLIPAIFGNGSNFVSTTLSSMFVSGEATSTQEQTTKTNTSNNNKQNNTSSNTSTNVAQTSVNTNQVQRVYYGKPDLEVTLISTGIIDPSSKQFVLTNYAGYNDEIAIRFEVKNVGTNISGPWKLRINAPSKTTPYYDSAYQTSIKPGDKIIYTTSFDSPNAVGINTAYITADPLNSIDENLESNNQITVPINIEGTSYTYANGYKYGNSYILSNTSYGTLYSWTNISASCYANPQTTYVGSPISWYVYASGGNGYFTYSWTGSDLLTANQSTVSKTYYSSGIKNATVTVTSNGQSVTAQCSAYVY